jgi:hypothetical protein
MSEQISKSDTSFIESTAECSVYDLDINYYNQPEWSNDFISALVDLNANINDK